MLWQVLSQSEKRLHCLCSQRMGLTSSTCPHSNHDRVAKNARVRQHTKQCTNNQAVNAKQCEPHATRES
eukprot:2390619-Amphidinium_carterae.2